MSRYAVLDTFPAFERYWARVRTFPIDRQIDSWRGEYLRPWPELAREPIASYAREGVSWRTVARTRIFPALEERLSEMRKVRSALRRSFPVAVRRYRAKWGLDFPVTFVLHVGIGSGAGQASSFRGRPAVIFGLENAAELGWSDPPTTLALVEHELAHLLHDHWRRQARVGAIDRPHGPWWHLYEEGFATRCEFLLGGTGSHHSTRETRDWLPWCRKHRSRLASLYLRAARSRASTRRFFGSWYDVDGYIETGYFLGAEAIRRWEKRFPLKQIACWDPRVAGRRVRASVDALAKPHAVGGHERIARRRLRYPPSPVRPPPSRSRAAGRSDGS